VDGWRIRVDEGERQRRERGGKEEEEEHGAPAHLVLAAVEEAPTRGPGRARHRWRWRWWWWRRVEQGRMRSWCVADGAADDSQPARHAR